MTMPKRPIKKLVLVAITLLAGWGIASSTPLAEVFGRPVKPAEPTVQRVPDLTAGAMPVVRIMSQDPVHKTTLYDVRIKNMTAGPLPAKSLVVVLDRITDNQTGVEVSTQFQVLHADGWTVDGKAYFRVPSAQNEWIEASDVGSPIHVVIHDRDEIPFYTPSFRVREIGVVGS
jgi:hypothetical protein